MVTAPPRRPGSPVILNGRPAELPPTVAPSPANAPSSGCIGRPYACRSPSNGTSPSARAAIGGTNLITVPARPQSTVPPAENRSGGVTSQRSPCSSIVTPSVRSASRIRAVSRASSPPVIADGPLDNAASTRARLVSDLEPGMVTVALTGTGAWGAVHG